MRAGWTGWSALSLAILTLVLVVTNVTLATLNQRLQAQAAARAQFIAEQTEYRRVGEALVRSLNAAAVSTKDSQLVAMMQRHGLAAPNGAPATQSGNTAAPAAPALKAPAPTTGKTR